MSHMDKQNKDREEETYSLFDFDVKKTPVTKELSNTSISRMFEVTRSSITFLCILISVLGHTI